MAGSETTRTAGQMRTGVGQDIRRLRRLQRMTIQELAEATGRSVDYLGRVERGLSQISVADLQRITRVLDVPLSWFFINEPPPAGERGYVVRANARRQVGHREGGLVEELLSPDLGGSYEVFRSVFEPGAVMAEAQTRNTEETGYLVSGRFRLFLDDRVFDLEAGDSFRFSGEHYRWENPGDEPAVIVWVISPPVY